MLRSLLEKITSTKLAVMISYIYEQLLFPRLLIAYVNTKFFLLKQLSWLIKTKKHHLPNQLIISLTSYPARFVTLHLTLKCLLMQTCSADRLILWIAHGDKQDLTPNIMSLEKYGLEIRFCEDFWSYTKIIPCLREYPDCYIVTADDDLYYDKKWLEALVFDHQVNVKEIIGHRAHLIKVDHNNYPIPYKDWELETDHTEYSEYTFLTGVGGVLYPPNSLYKDVTNAELFMKLCPRADDVWLYWMARLNGTRIRRTNTEKREQRVWRGSQKIGLYNSNLLQGGNDEQIRKINDTYRLFGQ